MYFSDISGWCPQTTMEKKLVSKTMEFWGNLGGITNYPKYRGSMNSRNMPCPQQNYRKRPRNGQKLEDRIIIFSRPFWEKWIIEKAGTSTDRQISILLFSNSVGCQSIIIVWMFMISTYLTGWWFGICVLFCSFQVQNGKLMKIQWPFSIAI